MSPTTSCELLCDILNVEDTDRKSGDRVQNQWVLVIGKIELLPEERSGENHNSGYTLNPALSQWGEHNKVDLRGEEVLVEFGQVVGRRVQPNHLNNSYLKKKMKSQFQFAFDLCFGWKLNKTFELR